MATLKSIKNKYLTASDGTVLGVTTNTENISALSFKLATADSLTKFNLVDGFSDDYNDATGVDTSGSTNEVRDSTNKYFSGSSSAAANATGGTITTSGGNTIHTLNTAGNGGSTNDFVTPGGSATVTYLIVGGGGAGGFNYAGGGGGGGFRTGTFSLGSGGTSATTYAVVAGAGGTGQSAMGADGDGDDSSFNGIVSAGGGQGASPGGNTNGRPGGSGGGGQDGGNGGAGNTPSTSPSQGNSGGGAGGNVGGGGGGAGGAGTAGSYNSNGGNGGAGTASSITGTSVTYAGGGGGGSSSTWPVGSGGSGGGGSGGNDSSINSTAGTDGLGGGGGGGSGSGNPHDGGNGVVIAAYTTNAFTSTNYLDMTLQSNAYTAQAAPTTARIILDELTAAGGTTLNTDLKAYASRNNGTSYTQITLADQGQLNYLAGIDQYTKLMLHCDGSDSGTTFTDSSATGHTMTASGNVHTDTTIKKFGTASAQFDGTTDYITSGASTEFSFTGDFTIDCWCYFSAINTTIAGSLSNWDWNSASTNDWILLVDGGGNVTFNVKGVGAISSAGHGALSAWKHIAVERASGTSKLYVDGALTATSTGPGSGTISANNIVTLGRAATNLTGAYNGYIDEFRISKGIARYGAAFIPAATPYEHSRRLLSGSVDISGQPSGTNMKYKIETLNQAVTKQTRIYGTSMAWA